MAKAMEKRARLKAQKAQQEEAAAAKVMQYDMATDNPHLARTVAAEIISDSTEGNDEAAGGGGAKTRERGRDETEEEYAQRRQARRGTEGGAAAEKVASKPANVTRRVTGLGMGGNGGDGEKEGAAKGGAPRQRARAPPATADDPAGQFDRMTNLEELTAGFADAVKEKRSGMVIAGLERIVEMCMKDSKLKIDDSLNAALLHHVVESMSWSKDNLVLVLSGCCALACLTKTKAAYPRTIWEAAANSGAIPALLSALTTLGPRFDHPAREALAHVTKNDKKAMQKCIDAGCGWLPALQKELAAADKAKK